MSDDTKTRAGEPSLEPVCACGHSAAVHSGTFRQCTHVISPQSLCRCKRTEGDVLRSALSSERQARETAERQRDVFVEAVRLRVQYHHADQMRTYGTDCALCACEVCAAYREYVSGSSSSPNAPEIPEQLESDIALLREWMIGVNVGEPFAEMQRAEYGALMRVLDAAGSSSETTRSSPIPSLDDLVAFIGNGENSRGAFPRNLSELSADCVELSQLAACVERAVAERETTTAPPAELPEDYDLNVLYDEHETRCACNPPRPLETLPIVGTICSWCGCYPAPSVEVSASPEGTSETQFQDRG